MTLGLDPTMASAAPALAALAGRAGVAPPPTRLTALPSGYPGQGTPDGECLREDAMRHQPTVRTLRDCGHPIPDLTSEPDMRHRAADVGRPFVATALGRDGRDHWCVRGMHGHSPSGSPTGNAPFRCEWLGGNTAHVASLRNRSADPYRSDA